MKTCFTFSLIVVALLSAASARAQPQLTLTIQDGRVTLDARNVPVRQILAEWAKVGGVKVVNAEKVAGAAVTLQLPDVPERQALDIVLRGVAGYLLASRAAGTQGASTFDRILILATSTPPKPPAGPGVQAAPGARPALMPPLQIQPPDLGDQSDTSGDADDDDTPPQPQQPRRFPGAPGAVGPGAPPRAFGAGAGGGAGPGGFQGGGGQGMPQAAGAPDGRTLPVAQPPQTIPANPFGVTAGSGGRPGVVTPVRPVPPNPPQGQAQAPGRLPGTVPDSITR